MVALRIVEPRNLFFFPLNLSSLSLEGGKKKYYLSFSVLYCWPIIAALARSLDDFQQFLAFSMVKLRSIAVNNFAFFSFLLPAIKLSDPIQRTLHYFVSFWFSFKYFSDHISFMVIFRDRNRRENVTIFNIFWYCCEVESSELRCGRPKRLLWMAFIKLVFGIIRHTYYYYVYL